METKAKVKAIFHLPYNCYSHVHRFMRAYLAEFEGIAAKCDARDAQALANLDNQFAELKAMLAMHAEFEDNAYHPLLENKADDILQEANRQHVDLDSKVAQLAELMDKTKNATSVEEKLSYGYQFYLSYTSFQAEYLQHLVYEERDIMHALNQHYHLDELRAVAFNTFKQMAAQDFLNMCKQLYPYLNAYEKAVFLRNLKDSNTEKFAAVWPEISSQLTATELKLIASDIGVDSQ